MVFASPTANSPTKVARQASALYGPGRLKFIAKWATYRSKYAYVNPLDVVRPAPQATGSIFNFENSTGRLWLGSNSENPIVGGLRLNLTSNLAPLAFGPLGQPSCDRTGGVAYETAFGFNTLGRLTLGGISKWRGCSTDSSVGLGPGINFQFGTGPSSTVDCQDLEIEWEPVVAPST
ncbi:hypothetical protein H072_8272 [Dactylellina haptotyla CBS 200.50]|uniref:Uncharacterized protein n=1 Tax=Dactylellina haptotyla (strain CBS 200.50) TaxID=1284197 RepID=S8AA88_DACHA|nr:hypothetical protein H072_8272 [Dactylellina haptotyla CBS 200.50]